MSGGMCYYISNITRTWFLARSDCLQRQGDLAKIGNVTTLNDIIKVVLNTQLKYWIGLVADIWRWTDGKLLEFFIIDEHLTAITCKILKPQSNFIQLHILLI